MLQDEAISANKLDFVAVGPFKTGTSYIYDYLSNYQQVALPTAVKETFFFDKKFARGLDWYYSHFARYKDARQVGEVAPSYFSSTEAAERIYQINPDCKIIVTLREPVSRLVSFYLHMKQRGEVKPQTSFLEAFNRVDVLQDTALYYHHLTRWMDIFGNNVKVIFFEELVKSPEDFCQRLCDELSLDLEQTDRDLSQKVNSAQSTANYGLAKLMYTSVNLLHDLGLHKLVDYGKSLGLKQMLLTNRGKKFELSDDEFIKAFELIEDDVFKLETSLDLDLTDWREVWQAKGIDLERTVSTN